MNVTIILIKGLKLGPSHIDTCDYADRLRLRFPSATILTPFDWNSKNIVSSLPSVNPLVKIHHSFGSNTGYLIDEGLYERDDDYDSSDPALAALNSLVYDYFIEPVRWETEEDVMKIEAFDDFAAAQVIDWKPFALPPNVEQARVYYRSDFIGPKTSRVTCSDLEEFILAGTDHDTAVDKAYELIEQDIAGLPIWS